MKYKKIIILGLTASGKTTFANELSKKFKIKVYHTDDLAYKRKWDIKNSEKEFKKELNKIIKKDKWIIEGVHSEWVLKGVKKADLVLFITTKKIIMAKRAMKRSQKGEKKNTFWQRLKLVYKIYKWRSGWYRKCKNYAKQFIELKNNKPVKELIKEIK